VKISNEPSLDRHYSPKLGSFIALKWECDMAAELNTGGLQQKDSKVKNPSLGPIEKHGGSGRIAFKPRPTRSE
jgi:hypothetical protein